MQRVLFLNDLQLLKLENVEFVPKHMQNYFLKLRVSKSLPVLLPIKSRVSLVEASVPIENFEV
jgi:hypothetical protein